jgi:hypothetical protein
MAFTFRGALPAGDQGPLHFVKWLKFTVLNGLCTASQPTPFPKVNPTQYWFSTSNHSYFTDIYKEWYIDKYILTSLDSVIIQRAKIMPSNSYLEQHFTAVALAFLIMGDGYWDKTVLICTDNFTYVEVCRFIEFLHHKLGLKATIKKRWNSERNAPGVGFAHPLYLFRVRFSGTVDNLNKLRTLVMPHMHKSLLYKLNLPHPQADKPQGP